MAWVLLSRPRPAARSSSVRIAAKHPQSLAEAGRCGSSPLLGDRLRVRRERDRVLVSAARTTVGASAARSTRQSKIRPRTRSDASPSVFAPAALPRVFSRPRFVTVEVCLGSAEQRKLACTERIIRSNLKVWIGIEDPDPAVAGRDIDHLRANGVEVQMFDSDLQQKITDQNKLFLNQALKRAGASAVLEQARVGSSAPGSKRFGDLGTDLELPVARR